MSTDVLVDIASHVAMSTSHGVVNYILLALEGSAEKPHDQEMDIKFFNRKGVKIQNNNAIYHPPNSSCFCLFPPRPYSQHKSTLHLLLFAQMSFSPRGFPCVHYLKLYPSLNYPSISASLSCSIFLQ